MFAWVLAATSGLPHRLEVTRGNERAARAYRRLGFRAVRVLHYYQLPREGTARAVGERGGRQACEHRDAAQLVDCAHAAGVSEGTGCSWRVSG
jgi:ribosomal protein S18 acetylase RimI-like enzyme